MHRLYTRGYPPRPTRVQSAAGPTSWHASPRPGCTLSTAVVDEYHTRRYLHQIGPPLRLAQSARHRHLPAMELNTRPPKRHRQRGSVLQSHCQPSTGRPAPASNRRAFCHRLAALDNTTIVNSPPAPRSLDSASSPTPRSETLAHTPRRLDPFQSLPLALSGRPNSLEVDSVRPPPVSTPLQPTSRPSSLGGLFPVTAP